VGDKNAALKAWTFKYKTKAKVIKNLASRTTLLPIGLLQHVVIIIFLAASAICRVRNALVARTT